MAPSLAIEDHQEEEIDEPRCRYCFLEHRPLVNICECSGSLEYVHEDCIIEWMTKQIEKYDQPEVPICQLCQEEYHATLTVGSRKVCNDILLDKVLELPRKDLLQGTGYLMGAVVAAWVLLSTIMKQLVWAIDQLQPDMDLGIEGLGVKGLFTEVVFPLIFLNSCIKFFDQFDYILEDSQVQMVELVLTPRVVLKA